MLFLSYSLLQCFQILAFLGTAAFLGKRALAICSISDNLVLGTELTPQERQTTFTNMMKIGLEAAVKMAQRG